MVVTALSSVVKVFEGHLNPSASRVSLLVSFLLLLKFFLIYDDQ
jgi:hypothetical protein